MEGVKNPSMGFDDGESAPKDLSENELLFIKEMLLGVESQFSTFLKDSNTVTKQGSFVVDMFHSFRYPHYINNLSTFMFTCTLSITGMLE